MDDEYKQLILSALVMFLPLFIYQMFIWENHVRHSPKKKVEIGLFAIGSCYLTMLFPFEIYPEYNFDFRLIPYLIGAMYGGPLVSIAIVIFMNLFTLFANEEGLVVSLLSSGLIWGSTLLLLQLYKSLSAKARIGVAVLITIGFHGLIYLSFLILDRSFIYIKDNMIEVVLFDGLAMLIAIFLVETMREQSHLFDELRQSEKLKVVGELAASVAHEVRNPLTVTRGFIQLMQQRKYSEDKRKEYMELAITELDRAQHILTDYLSYAKPQMEHVEHLNTSAEVQYVMDVMAPYASMQDVLMDSKLEEEIWMKGDRQKLHQCLINLTKNSIEAMQEGGILTINVSQRQGQAVIRIEDNGIGMMPEQVQRLGKPYFSNKEKGTGLGMMVVYSIVEVMGGTIQVESQFGRGTVFVLKFPMVDKS